MSIEESNIEGGGLGLEGRAEPAPVHPLLPPPRQLPFGVILPEGLDHQEYIRAFLEEFGAGDGLSTHCIDKAGNLLRIDAGVFEDRSGNPKSGKVGHGAFVRVVAMTILDPDEIWETSGLRPPGKNKKAAPRLKYLAQWVIAGRREPVLALFERTQYGFVAVSPSGKYWLYFLPFGVDLLAGSASPASRKTGRFSGRSPDGQSWVQEGLGAPSHPGRKAQKKTNHPVPG